MEETPINTVIFNNGRYWQPGRWESVALYYNTIKGLKILNGLIDQLE